MKPRTSASPVGVKAVAPPRRPPAWVCELLGRPALTDREDQAAFAALQEGLAAAIRPRDAVEWLLVANLADLEWNIRRLRLVKTVVVALSRDSAARTILGDAESKIGRRLSNDLNLDQGGIWAQVLVEVDSHLPSRESGAKAAYDLWHAALDAEPTEFAMAPCSDADGRSAFEREELAMQRLAELGLDGTALESVAFWLRQADMERLERLIAGYEARRSAILRDLERRCATRRASLARAQIIDAEFEA